MLLSNYILSIILLLSLLLIIYFIFLSNSNNWTVINTYKKKMNNKPAYKIVLKKGKKIQNITILENSKYYDYAEHFKVGDKIIVFFDYNNNNMIFKRV